MSMLSRTPESALRMSNVDARGVLHDSDRLRPYRAREKLEAQLRIEIPRLRQVDNANADVIDSDYLFHFSFPFRAKMSTDCNVCSMLSRNNLLLARVPGLGRDKDPGRE